jgi:3,4-dihydroxy 2-butanone 4-phosphate synthase/GTP cyclohydrolase II
MVTISDVVAYRWRHERLVERNADAVIATPHGDFRAIAFTNPLDDKVHVALIRGHVEGQSEVLARVHSECLTGDVFHSLRCDCGQQLESALARIATEPRGILLYLAQEGRGIGLLNKLKAYKLQEQGVDTVDANLQLGVPADAREYGVAAQMLSDLGVRSIRLMTNNPSKVRALRDFGISIVTRVPSEHLPTEHNASYLRTKRDRMGHQLHGLG